MVYEMDTDFDLIKINEIIKKRLSRVAPSVKKSFPSVLQKKKIRWVAITEAEYAMIVILGSGDKKRINDYISKKLNPFPGLITVKKESALFRAEGARYMTASECTVSNAYTFSLGKDSTIVLLNHTQSIETKNQGKLEYKIPLAYIVSYGDEINKATVYEYFDGLVAYSTNMWREAYAG